jgi:uncharacterized protein (DUF1499 family)
LLAVAGAWLANRGALPPYTAFRMFLLSIPVAWLAFVIGAIAVFRGRGGRNPAAKRKATVGSAAAVATIAAALGLAAPGAGYPVINDITTNIEDPPRFVAARRARPGAGEMAYPAAFAAEQKRAYPTIATRKLDVAPDEAFVRARQALESLPGTRVVDAAKGEGRIEAVSVSRVFHFTDDIVVRIRPSASGGSEIDIRSRSRDGRGDLGVNAQRIDNLLTMLR